MQAPASPPATEREVSAEELIRNADLAMYRAKYDSKHRYELFESGMEVPVQRRHRLKVRLRDAVRDDAFVSSLPADRRRWRPDA